MKKHDFREDEDFLDEDGFSEEDEFPVEDEFPEEEPALEDPETDMLFDEPFDEDQFFPEDAGEEDPADEYFEEAFAENGPADDADPFEEEFTENDPADDGGAFSGDEEDLFHESLENPDTREELTGDDHAMYAAGLTHPEDAEFHFPEEEVLPLEQVYQDDTGGEDAPADAPEDNANPPEDTPARRERRRERPARKGRPKHRKGSGLLGIPHLIAAAIWLLVIVAIGVSLGRMIWVCAADVLAFGRESHEVTVSITTDDTMESIAEKLQDAGLIRYKQLFLLYADLSHADQKITTGTFTLNTIYDYNALVKQMFPRSGNRAVVEDVLIPEGYSCRQIFQRLEEKGVCKAADLEAWAATGELGDYWFLEGVARGDKYCLEGYLFPATYDFYENSTPKQVLTKMLDAFEANFTEELQAQLPALNEHISQMMRDDGKSEEYIAQNQISLHQLVTVASLIEKETASHEESPKIASVIYNRLFSWGDTPRYLNIDASVIYALDGKTNLTAEDMAVDSPYNTYTHTGITPGPISNPGIASLKAALNPEDAPYYYYVLNPETGEHEFTKTYEDHQKLVEKFKNATNE